MTKRYFFITIIFVSATFTVAGQKAISAGNNKSTERNSEPVEINIDTLGLWLQNTADQREPRIKEFKVDSIYTYFKRNRNYYKTKNVPLRKLNYQALVGDSILNSFYHNIIPLVDRKKEEHCLTALIKFDYKYKYMEVDETIEVTCHYKVTCEFVIRVFKKSYMALYDLKAKRFRK